MPDDVDAGWVATDSVEARDSTARPPCGFSPGRPTATRTAAFAAIEHCLATRTPFLGTCGGFQYACLHLARRFGADARHAETYPDAAEPAIAPLACSLYGETRTVTPVAGTRLAAICGDAPFEGFHWCGYGLADRAAELLQANGVVVSATAPDAGVEAIELPEHPFFLATAFQPQVGSSTTGRLHPLIEALLDTARVAV